MKSFFGVFGVSMLATNAFAANLDSYAAPVTTPVTATPNCGLAISDFQIKNKDCGIAANNPCFVTRKTADANLCNQRYLLAYDDGKQNGMKATVFVQVKEIDDTLTGEFAVSQYAWGRLCPYQCKSDNRCVKSPVECDSGEFVADYIENGVLLPGSVEPSAQTLPMQFKSVDGQGHEDQKDNSDDVTMVDYPYFVSIYATPFRFSGKTATCPALDMPQDKVLDSSCGTPSNPCLVASDPSQCGTCLKVTAVQRGLKEVSPTLCKNGECPAYVDTKIIRIVAEGTGATPFAVFEASEGYWSGLCPFLCKDATSGAEYCVPTADHCLVGAEPTEKIPAADGWNEYDEAGSMKASPIKLVGFEKVECSEEIGNSAHRVAYTGAAVAGALAALALAL